MKAVKVEWVGAEIGGMIPRIVGDVKRTEVVDKTKMRMLRKFM